MEFPESEYGVRSRYSGLVRLRLSQGVLSTRYTGNLNLCSTAVWGGDRYEVSSTK